MTVRTHIKTTLLLALIAISLGGLILHFRLHPVSHNTSNFLPLIAGILSVIVVPLLFSGRKVMSYAYVLNGFLAIVGTVAMAHFSIEHWPEPASVASIITQTTLADIIILWTMFFVGKAIFDLELFGYDPKRKKGGVSYRYPNTGWWLIHFVAVSVVYTLGNWIWR